MEDTTSGTWQWPARQCFLSLQQPPSSSFSGRVSSSRAKSLKISPRNVSGAINHTSHRSGIFGIGLYRCGNRVCAVCRSFRIYGLVAETLAWFDVGDGICKGLAFLAKLTTVLFLPAAAVLRSKWLAEHQSKFSIRGSGFEGAPVQGRRHDANGSAVFRGSTAGAARKRMVGDQPACAALR